MSDAKPIENWGFFYVRLQGTADFRGTVQRVTTSPVISIETTDEGDIATTKSGSRYLLGACDPAKTREEWFQNWKYWNELGKK